MVLYHVPVSNSHFLFEDDPTADFKTSCAKCGLSEACWVLAVPALEVMLGFDEHAQPVHLLPLQLVQLGP